MEHAASEERGSRTERKQRLHVLRSEEHPLRGIHSTVWLKAEVIELRATVFDAGQFAGHDAT
jgi:hypothetical protein